MDRAVVVGAGMAGLATARILADRCAEVVLLDRDRLPGEATPRRGVPQSSHAHVLLAAGQRALEELFPGLRAELIEAGATPFDFGADLYVHRFTAWPPLATGLELLAMSRPLLELSVRRRVAAKPGVTIRDQVAVSGLTGEDGQVTGVVLDDGETIAADLVVDCSGRGARSDRWLAALGFPSPEVTEVKVDVGYATRLLRRKPDHLPGRVGAFLLPDPPDQRRVGLALPIEGDRWIVGLGGWHGDYPVAEASAYAEHARRLADPAIADLLDAAEPISDVVGFRFPSSRRRRFERLRRVPGGYAALGDAVCSFNPVYGQGMTCAVLQAVALGEALDRRGAATAGTVRAYYRSVGRILATPWRFAAGGDFAFPQTQGHRAPGTALLNRYSRRIQLAARTSPEIRRTFSTVQHLIEPPSLLWKPGMVWKILRESR